IVPGFDYEFVLFSGLGIEGNPLGIILVDAKCSKDRCQRTGKLLLFTFILSVKRSAFGLSNVTFSALYSSGQRFPDSGPTCRTAKDSPYRPAPIGLYFPLGLRLMFRILA